jgi:hypothetical protein
MSFFNKKEDVIDIKLTQYGKLLLSKGGFNPVSYRFFDDGVLYDAAHAGIVENQNDAEDRIREAQHPRTQYVFAGIETKVDQLHEAISSGELPLELADILPDNEERENALRYNLSTNTFTSQDMSYLRVDAYGAPLTGSLQYYSGSNVPQVVPQLTCEATYNISKETIENPELLEEFYLSEDYMEGSVVFQDAVYSLDEEYMLFDLHELNTSRDNDNFEVSVYEIVPGTATDDEEVLIPLHHGDLENPLKDVNNYFEILLDTQIPDYLLDQLIAGEFGRRGIFNRSLRSSSGGTIIRDIYETGIPNIEECD